MGNLTKFQSKSMYDILYNKSEMYTWVHDFNLRTLLSFQSQIGEGLVHFKENIDIIIIFTYITCIYNYILYIAFICIFAYNAPNS